MKNNSYVYIPTDKLVAIIKYTCPPIDNDVYCGCHGEPAKADCVKCWKSWLMDGE